MPGSFQVLSPTETASEATTKNQPPDIDIIVFQTRPGVANGTSRRQNFCQGVSRKLIDASRRSAGTVRRDWYKLNAMFQAWLVKIAKMAASSSPSTWPGNKFMKKTTVNVRKPRIGTDWRMSSTGISMAPARALLAAAVPKVNVNRRDAANAANMRSVVRTAYSGKCQGSRLISTAPGDSMRAKVPRAT